MAVRSRVIVIAATAACCAGPPEDLPDVKTATLLAEPCLEEPRAIPPLANHSQNPPDLGVCVKAAWASRCEGRMSFEADVEASGEVVAVRFKGDVTPELRRCIRTVVMGAVVLKPVQCSGAHYSSQVGGGISWPRDGGTFVYFAGESFIVACLRECSEAARGPTSGCS